MGIAKSKAITGGGSAKVARRTFGSQISPRRWSVVGLIVLLGYGVYHFLYTTSSLDSQRDSFDYIRLNGYGSPVNSYVHAEFHAVLRGIIGDGADYLCSSKVSVCMSPDALTDSMLLHLRKIDNLNYVFVYRRIDQRDNPRSRMISVPLSQLNVPASAERLLEFERDRPSVTVVVPSKTKSEYLRDR